MKKLLMLFLVLTGYVCSVSATNYTVFFKPDSRWAGNAAKFALYMMTSADAFYTVNFEEVGTSGIYSATYDSNYDKGIIIVRIDPSMVKENGSGSIYGWRNEGKGFWNQSGDLPAPTSDIYYDKSNNDWWDTWVENTSGMTVTDLVSSWVVAANRHIAKNYDSWSASSANNQMTTTDGVNYTLTVSNRPLKAGSYGFKFVGDGTWYGDPSNSGNDYHLEISEDDYYDITYSLNRITNTGSVKKTAKNSANKDKIEYKYFVYDNDAGSWDGITAFTGKPWYQCEMINNDGTYVYAIKNIQLAAGTKYGSRFIEQVYVDGDAVQSNWLWIGDGDGGVQGCINYDCTSTGKYNVVFSYTPASNHFDFGSSQPKLSVTSGFYFFNSGDSWETGAAMDFDEADGVYTIDAADLYNKYFALCPESSLGDWSKAIRPGNYDSSYNIEFSTWDYSGTGYTGSQATWKVTQDGYSINVRYNPGNNAWKVTPFIEKTLATAAEGYATFSSAYNVAIPSGITAQYATSSSNGAIEWSNLTTGIPANTGVLLSGNAGDTYKFTPTASTDNVSGNKLVAIPSATQLAQTADGNTNYILSKKNNLVAFYKVNSAGSYVAAGTAYLQVASGSGLAPAFISLDGETTAIDAIDLDEQTSKEANATIFDLSGRKVNANNLPKGIYVKNGKKFIIK